VISVDGHPVRGAFTFAVGPNAGPPPEFQTPSLTETAASPGLLVERWIVLLSMMASIGLAMFRLLVARPLIRRVDGSSLRAITTALFVALGVAVISTLVYVLAATARFAQVGFFDLGTTIPLVRDSAFGRGYSDLALILVLLGIALAAAIRVDRPEREKRSIAELGASLGAVAAGASALLVPGLAGHASQYSPRGAGMLLDWTHLLAGSVWVGGLVGLLVLAWRSAAQRVACMVAVVPRFSRTALISTAVLIASGTIAAILRLPTLSSLWDTGYGQALIAKIAILLVALGIASVNLLRTTPRLQACDRRPELGDPTTSLLRRLVGGETFLVFGAIFAAGVMSSVAPPPKALGEIGTATASVGPGPVNKTVQEAGYELQLGVTPNRATRPNAFSVKLTKDGKPVTGADVVAKFTMLDMEMGQQAYKFKELSPSLYGHRSLPALVMVGHWGLDFTITPRGGKSFQVLLLDKALG
jgi:copper transport protein